MFCILTFRISKFLTILVISSIWTNFFSSEIRSQSITWSRIYSHPQPEAVRNGIQTFDGGYVALATRVGVGGGILLIKLDAFGNMLWSKIVDTTSSGFCIRQCADSGLTISGNQNNQGILLKTNKNGDVIWKQMYLIDGLYTLFRSLHILENGNYLICGSVSFFPAYGFIMQTDSVGGIIWERTFSSTNGEPYPWDFCKSNDNYIYITGSVEGNVIRTLVAKFAINGNRIWVKNFGSDKKGDSQYSLSIVSNSNMEFFLTGDYSNFFSDEAHFTKIDSSGTVIFQNILPQTNSARSMIRTSNNNFAIAGGLSTSSDDILYLQLNENGDIQYRKLFNSNGIESDYSVSIIETSDKGFLITGYTTYLNSNEIDLNPYLIKTDSTGNAPPLKIKVMSNQIPIDFMLHQNFPNPFNSSTLIRFDVRESSFLILEVFDNNGKSIGKFMEEFLYPGTYQVKFESNILSSGIYFYNLRSANFSSTKKMLMIK